MLPNCMLKCSLARESTASTSAPAAISCSNTAATHSSAAAGLSQGPEHAATVCRGVLPPLPGWFTAATAASSSWTIKEASIAYSAVCNLSAAKCSRGEPYWSTALTEAPAAISCLTCSKLPLLSASVMAVSRAALVSMKQSSDEQTNDNEAKQRARLKQCANENKNDCAVSSGCLDIAATDAGRRAGRCCGAAWCAVT